MSSGVRRSGRAKTTLVAPPPPDDSDADEEPVVEAKKQTFVPKTKAAPATAPKAKTAAKSAAAKSVTSNAKANERGKALPIPAASSGDTISSLPAEIRIMIVDNITEKKDLNAWCKTSKSMYVEAMPRLYGRISVAAMHNPTIPRLIRTLEPLMAIDQRKMLKKQGKYAGQQEIYPKGIRPDARPICATYVRQFTVGVIDPGRKHQRAIEGYVEEAFKCMPNLEAVDVYRITDSMAESIASLAHLRALKFTMASDGFEPMGRLKNLVHIHAQCGVMPTGIKIMNSIIRQSRDTLQSLNMTQYSGDSLFETLFDHEPFTLSNLKSLSIFGAHMTKKAVEGITTGIDFTKLLYLDIGHLQSTFGLTFYHKLLSINQESPSVKLEVLVLSMDHGGGWPKPTETEIRAVHHCKLKLISSYSNLTSLQLKAYGSYPMTNEHNPGLESALIDAILANPLLKVLRINYTGIVSGETVPYVHPEQMARLTKGLPKLEEIEFAIDEQQVEETAKTLVELKHLTSITTFPFKSWANYTPDRETEPELRILQKILQVFLDVAQEEGGGGIRIWTDCYKLDKFSVSYRTWDIAAMFGKVGKPPKGTPKPKPAKMMASEDGNIQVWFREPPPIKFVHVGFDPLYTWMNEVSGSIDTFKRK